MSGGVMRRWLIKFGDWLTKPEASIQEPARRRRAQFLTSFLVVIVALAWLVEALIIAADPGGGYEGYKITLIATLFLGIAFGLSRTRYYYLAAWYTLVVLSIAIFIAAFFANSPPNLEVPFFLVIPLLLSSIFISHKGPVVLGIVYISTLLLIPVFTPAVEFIQVLTGPLALVVIFSGTVSLLTRYRDLVEQDRRRDLIEQEERYRNLFERVPVGLYRTTQEGQFLEANNALANILGYADRESLLAENATSVFDDPEERTKWREIIERDGLIEYMEWGLRKRDGTRIWISDRAKVVYDEEGQVMCYEGSLEDVTERKQAEEALRESESRYSTLVNNAGDAIFVYDLQGRMLDVNKVACERLGYSREELLQMTPGDIDAPEYAKLEAESMQMLKEWGDYLFETAHLAKDGTVVPTEISARVIKYAGNQAVLSIARDITDRKRHDLEQETILKVATALRSAETRAAMLPIILNHILDVFNGAGAAFAMRDPDNGETVFEMAQGTWKDITGERLTAGEGLSGRVLSNGKLYHRNDLREDPQVTLTRRHPELDSMLSMSGTGQTGFLLRHRSETSAVTGVPLIAQDENIGVLWVGRSQPFFSEDIQLITAIAEMAANAIQRAALHEETKARLDNLSMLYNLSQQLSTSSLQLREIAMTIARQFVEVMGLPECSISLLDFQGRALRTIVDYYIEREREYLEEDWIEKVIYLADYPATAGVLERLEPLVVHASDPDADPAELAYMQEEEITTLAMLPLVVKGEAIGILELEIWDEEYYFSPEELNLAMTLANQAALALEHARLFEDERRRSQELEAVAQVSSALRKVDSRSQMVTIILDQLLNILHSEGALLAVCEPNSGKLVLELGMGVWAGVVDKQNLSEEEGFGVVFATRKPYIDNDAGYFYEQQGLPSVTQSVAGIPLIAKNEHIGMVWLGSNEEFTGTDIRLLTAIGDITANAIRRETLHEETQRRIERLDALHNIDRAITTSFDLNDILNVLLDQVISQLGVDAVDLLLYENPTYTLIYAGGRGFRADIVFNTAVKVGRGVAGRVALERRIIHIPDLSTAEHGLFGSAVLAEEGFVTYFGVPLIAKGQVKGVLELYHRTALEPNQEWMNFLDSLARQAAIAIDNSSLFENLQRSNLELTLAYDTTLEGWAKALELRDKETEGHSRRVTEMSMSLARMLGVNEENLIHVRRGALLHDIGKMGIPDSILQKPGPLTEDEWEIMRQHPGFAFDLLSSVPYLTQTLDIPYCHHEKWDGTGYPRGLKGEQIPLAARVFAVIDVWDALNSDRPYREAWKEDKVREYIRDQAGMHFDPQVVEAFLQILSESVQK